MRVAAQALLTALVLLASSLIAQGPYRVGARYEAFINPTSSGSSLLYSSVYYPAITDGYQAPIVKRSGGHPVLVFLHGFGAVGQMYPELAFDWARAGYVVVLQNTAQNDPPLQIKDGTAVFHALVKENSTRGSFYEGQLDTKRFVIAGHSVGGANAVHVLANNPGYRAGFAWSPYAGVDGKYTASSGPKITVPFGVAGGVGDKVTPWDKHGRPIYDNLNTNVLKFAYVFDEEGDHATVVSWTTSKLPVALDVFTRSMLVARGLFDHVLFGDPGSLDEAIGLTARVDAHLRSLSTDVQTPCYIKRGVDRIGQLALFQLVAADGYAVHMLALQRIETTTPVGTLYLDPNTIFILQVTYQTNAGIALYPHLVPNDVRMKGLVFPVQALLIGSRGVELSNELMLAVPK
ncbi:MAG: hypothetical protein H6832_15270 [Planctomycetes bacterium]|nr:hypothetical protein [Planctomycetota bacterium]MCB9892675.1 hypothetical protein [Planctomycetota bacterium]MCB9919761.1 hypothetical protein [Planctomycetota bacterium]